MAREFSRAFYKSKEWKKAREYIFKQYNGICQDCLDKDIFKKISSMENLKDSYIEKNLDEININIPEVALGSDNLILLCKECHHKRHKNNKITSDDLIFNENGELIMKQAPPY